MNADKKKRLQGRWVVALILLFGAAYSIYDTCIRKQYVEAITARPIKETSLEVGTVHSATVTIVREQVILEELSSYSFCPNVWQLSVSPTGRYVVYHAPTDLMHVIGPRGEPFLVKENGLLIDVQAGAQWVPPFPPGKFTSDGKHMHAFWLFAGSGDYREDKAWVILYELESRKMRKVDVGPCSGLCDDAGGEYLFVTMGNIETKGENYTAVIPVAGGSVRTYQTGGAAVAAYSEDRVAIASANDLSVVNLFNGKTVKIFPRNNDLCWLLPLPVWTPDGRFFSYCIWQKQRRLDAEPQDRLSRLPPLMAKSSDEEEETVALSRIWDSKNDSITSLRGFVAIGPGPLPGSVFIAKQSGWIGHDDMDFRSWADLRLLDLTTRRAYRLPAHEKDVVLCARGKFAAYAVRNSKGNWTFVLVEIGVPGMAR